jgi:hypothetical protein
VYSILGFKYSHLQNAKLKEEGVFESGCSLRIVGLGVIED